MKKIVSLVGQAALACGVFYALLVIAAVPAFADCTPTDCSALQTNVAQICQAEGQQRGLNCSYGGEVRTCIPSWYEIYCYICEVDISGPCN